jgi:hypothetical protein
VSRFSPARMRFSRDEGHERGVLGCFASSLGEVTARNIWWDRGCCECSLWA